MEMGRHRIFKQCKICGSTNPYKNGRGMCQKCYNKWWIKNNRDKWNKISANNQKKWRRNNPEKYNKIHAKNRKHYRETFGYNEKLYQKAKEFFQDEKDAFIFVADGIELERKLKQS